MISLEKWKILTPLQKLPKNVGDLGKIIVAKGFKSWPKSDKSPNLVTLISRDLLLDNNARKSIFNGPFPASLFPVNRKYLNFADDWIWTVDLWNQTWPLCQLSPKE